MATSTYNHVHSLRRKGWTPAKIADELGVSRQRVHQLLALATPPGESHLKHGTATMAARCDCPACDACKRLNRNRCSHDLNRINRKARRELGSGHW